MEYGGPSVRGPSACGPRARAPGCGCGTRTPCARLRSTRAPCGADRTPPPGLRVPERPGTGAVRARRARGSGPHAHHVVRTGPLRLRSAYPSARVRARYAHAVRAAPVHTRTMWCGQDPSAWAPRARAPGCGCGCASGRAAPVADCGPHATYVVGAGPLCLRSACPGAGAVRRRCAAIRAGPAGGSGPHAHHVQWTGPLRLRSVRPGAGAVRAGRAPRSAQPQRAAQAHTRTMCSGVSRTPGVPCRS